MTGDISYGEIELERGAQITGKLNVRERSAQSSAGFEPAQRRPTQAPPDQRCEGGRRSAARLPPSCIAPALTAESARPGFCQRRRLRSTGRLATE